MDPRKEPDEPASNRTLESMPAQPDAKKTVNLPAMTDRALLEDLRGVVKEGFRLTRADIELVSNDLSVVKDRVSILESERSKLSGGVRALSQNDLAHEAQLGLARAAAEEEKRKREALERTAATKDELKAIAQSVADAQTNAIGSLISDAARSKMGQRLLQAAGVLLLAAMGTAGGYLARGNVQTPQPTIIQVAPVVAAADGGLR